jgi:transcriptional regulator with XRE-family HTH domain
MHDLVAGGIFWSVRAICSSLAMSQLSMHATEFPGSLQAARRGAGYASAREFARALGIHENRYSRYERGDAEPDLALLCKICTRLGKSPNELLGFGTPGPSSAAGFSDAVPQSLRRERTAPAHRSQDIEGTELPTLDPVDALIWSFCEQFLSRRPAARGTGKRTSRDQSPSSEAVAKLYMSLRPQPLTAVAALLTSDTYAARTAADKRSLEPAIAAIIGAVTGRTRQTAMRPASGT